MPVDTLRLRSRPFPMGAPPHVTRYLEGDGRLDGLYAGYPPSGSRTLPERADSHSPLSRSTAGKIRELNLRAGGETRSLDGIDRPETRFVLAGQQPGLLLGPMLTIYKILSSSALASKWTEETGETILPLFWIASHDSDLEEVNRVTIPDAEGNPRVFLYPFTGHTTRRQVGALTVDRAGWTTFLRSLEPALPRSTFRDELLERLGGLVREETDITLLFARIVHDLFPGRVLLLDGRDAESDPRALAVLASAVREPDRTLAALESGAAAVREAGHPIVLPPIDRRLPLFLLDGETRVPIRLDGGTIRPEGKEAVAPGELADRIEAGTVRVTPAAALRPVVQDAILPVAATVVGQSELLYHAQLGPLYRLFGVHRPLLVPRASLFLFSRRLEERLEKLSATPESVLAGEEGGDGSERLEGALDGFRRVVERETGELLRRVEEVVPGAVPPRDPARVRILKEADRTADRLRKLADRAGENRGNLFHKVRNELFPGGKPQEQILSPVHPLARYGPGFPEALVENTAPGDGSCRIAVPERGEDS